MTTPNAEQLAEPLASVLNDLGHSDGERYHCCRFCECPERAAHKSDCPIAGAIRAVATALSAATAAALEAAAQHRAIVGYCFSLYRLECSCGWSGNGSWKHVDKAQFDSEWQQHIRSLTEADIAAAQARRDARVRQETKAYIVKALSDGRYFAARPFVESIDVSALAAAEGGSK